MLRATYELVYHTCRLGASTACVSTNACPLPVWHTIACVAPLPPHQVSPADGNAAARGVLCRGLCAPGEVTVCNCMLALLCTPGEGTVFNHVLACTM